MEIRLRKALPSSRNAGMTLVDLMISIAIGLVLLAGIAALIQQQSHANGELNKASRQIENGRYAAQLLREDIQHAGYYGEFFNLPAATSLPDLSSTGVSDLDAATALPVQGYDAPSVAPPALSTYLNAANFLSGTDILVVRHADTTVLPAASATAGEIYVQAGLNPSKEFAKIVDSGTDPSVFTLKKRDGTLAGLRRYLAHIYFISPCNVPATGTECNGSTDDDGKSIPTLKRLELTVQSGAATFAMVPLVEGIQNLQVDYGIDKDGDGAPDYYSAGTYSTGTTPMTAADWSDVMTVRVNILARNNEPSAGHADSKTYNMGEAGMVGPFADRYKRRVFTEVVRLINPSGRRAR